MDVKEKTKDGDGQDSFEIGQKRSLPTKYRKTNGYHPLPCSQMRREKVDRLRISEEGKVSERETKTCWTGTETKPGIE